MKIKKNDGVTVIELIIVTTIVSILVVALGFSFQGWMGGYKVESQVKEMYVDLMNTRSRALQRNRVHFVDFPDTTSYSIYEDTNPAPDGNGTLETAADTLLPTFPKTIENFLIEEGGIITWTGGIITLNARGIAEVEIPSPPPPPPAVPEETICIFTDFDGDAANLSDYDPDYDCIEISQTRINLGKLTTQDTGGGACNAVNCVAR